VELRSSSGWTFRAFCRIQDGWGAPRVLRPLRGTTCSGRGRASTPYSVVKLRHATAVGHGAKSRNLVKKGAQARHTPSLTAPQRTGVDSPCGTTSSRRGPPRRQQFWTGRNRRRCRPPPRLRSSPCCPEKSSFAPSPEGCAHASTGSICSNRWHNWRGSAHQPGTPQLGRLSRPRASAGHAQGVATNTDWPAPGPAATCSQRAWPAGRAHGTQAAGLPDFVSGFKADGLSRPQMPPKRPIFKGFSTRVMARCCRDGRRNGNSCGNTPGPVAA